MRLLTVLVLLLNFTLLHGQHYRFHEYRVEQGLPSDVIKSVTEDSLGFFWIATDDGLVKYDGVKFSHYRKAFRSQYAKGFLHTSDGRLLAFSDLDVIEIQNKIDTVIFKNVLKGDRLFNDSSIWFTKAMYQDRTGTIWLSEPKAVVKYDGESIKRYEFDNINRSPFYLRSFSLFEDDDNNLYAISYPGYLSWYDRDQDKFIQQKNLKLPDEISHVLYVKDQLLLAARQGVYSVKFENHKAKPAVNIFPVQRVSNLLLSSDSLVYVSTYAEDLYKLSFKNGFEWESMYYNFNGINNSYISRENDVWIASEKGLVRIQKNLFGVADVNSHAQFVEDIAFDVKDNTIYYANQESLIKLTNTGEGEWKRNVLLEGKNNYFQSIQLGKKGLWASSTWNVLLLQQGQVVKKWDFNNDGNFINSIFLDSKDNLWISQAGTGYINVITDSFSLRRHSVPDLKSNEINHIAEGNEGIYAVASGGKHGYLFFKSHEDTVFRNKSLPINFEVRSDFNVVHLAIHRDILWLASSEGLLRYDHKTLTRLNFGEAFEEYAVSCVEVLDEDNILFSNSFGLFRYNVKTGEYWLYDESSGLPSNSITNHGILVTPKKQVWLGTSSGLAFASDDIIKSRPTRSPYCVDARVNGEARRFINGLRTAYGDYITLQFSPISFPENKINLQWRINDSEKWRTIKNNQISLSNLKAGVHQVFVRAKKNTGFGWSEPVTLTVIADSPYWKKPSFIFLVVLAVVMVSWASYAISSFITDKRKAYLQHQIKERTSELQKANEELMQRNTELDRFVYSASHDLSAPLKSILGLIRVSKMDEPGETHMQYLSMMERSVNKLENFIHEVVSYSRNTRMPVKLESFSFKELVESLLLDHEYSPNFKHITFVVEDELSVPMVSDLMRMKIILNNLLSNAIKFHWIDIDRKPFIKILLREEKNEYVIEISDNGRGISEDHIKRIFEMFYRATDDAQGSGLGLYILKESVIKLGGTVEATSNIDEGTIFTIRLPVPAH